MLDFTRGFSSETAGLLAHKAKPRPQIPPTRPTKRTLGTRLSLTLLKFYIRTVINKQCLVTAQWIQYGYFLVPFLQTVNTSIQELTKVNKGFVLL